MNKIVLAPLLSIAVVGVLLAQNPPPQPPQQQTNVVTTKITGDPGLPPKLAVPEFLALTSDAETVAAAKLISASINHRSPCCSNTT